LRERRRRRRGLSPAAACLPNMLRCGDRRPDQTGAGNNQDGKQHTHRCNQDSKAPSDDLCPMTHLREVHATLGCAGRGSTSACNSETRCFFQVSCAILKRNRGEVLVLSPSRIRERGRGAVQGVESGRPRLFTLRRKAATSLAGVLALIMGYGVVFGHNGLTAYQAKRTEEHRLKEQMQQLEKENSRLRGHVDRLRDDPSAIEHEAREELHYTRAGEVIYTLPASDLTPDPGHKTQ
jgi:cell division protein FtsB